MPILPNVDTLSQGIDQTFTEEGGRLNSEIGKANYKRKRGGDWARLHLVSKHTFAVLMTDLISPALI